MRYLAVYAIAYSAIAVSAIKLSPPSIWRSLRIHMKDVLLSLTVFHALAAIGIFGFMLFSVVKLVRGQKH